MPHTLCPFENLMVLRDIHYEVLALHYRPSPLPHIHKKTCLTCAGPKLPLCIQCEFYEIIGVSLESVLKPCFSSAYLLKQLLQRT